MSSNIQLRMAGEEIAAMFETDKEKIGMLTILHNEPHVTLKVSITDGYIIDMPRGHPYCKQLSEYYPWIKTLCVTGGGIDEPPIDKMYYVKSSNPRMIEVTIYEYSKDVPYTRTYTLSMEKQPLPEGAAELVRNNVPSVTLPVMLDSGGSDYEYNCNDEYGYLTSRTLENIIKDIDPTNISPPKLMRASNCTPFGVMRVAEEEL